eukprot:366498-Chlamydomonas_euryale.AAC.6
MEWAVKQLHKSIQVFFKVESLLSSVLFCTTDTARRLRYHDTFTSWEMSGLIVTYCTGRTLVPTKGQFKAPSCEDGDVG